VASSSTRRRPQCPEQEKEALTMTVEMYARELAQAKLIIAERSLRKDVAKYGRI